MQPFDPLHQCTDEELLNSFRKGRTEVFGILVRRYQREIYSYLRRYLGDANLADDVFQNTFLQVYLKADQYEMGRPFRPWLYTIAFHQAIDALRRHGRHPAVSLDQISGSDHQANETPSSLADLLESRETDPFENLELEEKRQLIRGAVDQLPDFLKQVVILAYYQGLKYKEVAEILDIPVGTVKSRLHTAIAKLYDLWKDSPTLPRV